jgi:preprotein translocase subunit YajC
MVNAILKAGTPVEFTLTGIAGTVKAIKNDRVLIENAKGETLNPTLAEVETMLKSGGLKV